MIFLLILLLSGNGYCADLTDPYDIMHSHYAAVGGLERLKSIISSHSQGRVHYDGLKGTFKHWEKRPLQHRTEEDYTIISQIEGDSGSYSWFYDTNGQLLINRDEDTLKRRRISILLDQYEHLDRQSPHFSMTFAGVVNIKDRPCYEVVLRNTINSDVGHFFFDAETMHMVRSLYKQPDMEIESVYDDFRDIDGIVIAFHQHNTFHPWEKTEETWTTEYSSNQPVDEALFVPPQKDKGYHFRDGENSASIAFDFIENLIFLPLTIGSDTRYWALDSGASMSVIDQEYAEGLGLDVQGTIRGYGFGELFDLSFVKVPEYQVGTIHFGSQKLYVSKGLTAKSYEPVIAGILGYDFLSRFVVEIDYDQQELTFHAPETFVYKGRGAVIDAPLKYRTFALPVVLDGKYESRWALDLGSYHSSIHFPFAEKHGLLNSKGVEIVSQGMSGLSRELNVQFGCLKIDRFNLSEPVIAIPLEKGVGATALGEVGGNLGNSTLRHFHLFLNYPEQKIILEPGKNFATIFPRDKSGLVIGRGDNNQPMISFVAGNSPAEDLGLLAGDIIVEMAGQAVGPNDPIVPLRSLLRGETNSIPLKIQREEQILSGDLILKDLYPQDSGTCTHSTK